MAETSRQQVPTVFRWLDVVNRYLSEDFLGGPKVLKMAWVINLQKGTTLLFIGVLMLACSNTSTAAWVYLALHGTYGLCWLLKHMAFPDASWDRRVTFGGAVMTWVCVLGLYWVFPVLLITPVLGLERAQQSGALLATCISVHTLGVVIMMAADCQKSMTLALRPGLITTGMFARIRHPNYLGEMLLYGSYALLVGHWIAWVILAWVWGGVFLTNMLHKEASLSRYPEWPAYQARTGMLLPRLVRRRTASAARP